MKDKIDSNTELNVFLHENHDDEFLTNMDESNYNSSNKNSDTSSLESDFKDFTIFRKTKGNSSSETRVLF
jgi:hypothetical protein